jgi:hypothetical protein
MKKFGGPEKLSPLHLVNSDIHQANQQKRNNFCLFPFAFCLFPATPDFLLP